MLWLIKLKCFALTKRTGLNGLVWAAFGKFTKRPKRFFPIRATLCFGTNHKYVAERSEWVCIKASLPTTGCQLSLLLATCHHIPSAAYRNITAANMSITRPHAVSNQIYGDAKRICVTSTMCVWTVCKFTEENVRTDEGRVCAQIIWSCPADQNIAVKRQGRQCANLHGCPAVRLTGCRQYVRLARHLQARVQTLPAVPTGRQFILTFTSASRRKLKLLQI